MFLARSCSSLGQETGENEARSVYAVLYAVDEGALHILTALTNALDTVQKVRLNPLCQ